jgi:hypothetical protein
MKMLTSQGRAKMTKSSKGRYTVYHPTANITEKLDIRVIRREKPLIKSETEHMKETRIMDNETMDYNQHELQNRLGTWLSERPALSVLIASIGLIVFGILFVRAI